ncbi:polysaccharide biosynthesis C-terminal domain-containing protein [Flavobacterium sp. MAH-1]|uniref:Polysaccharide biosynthesis C-terminal domain-containing protein n=1 Tax=Flavobacterium agri TaxID=2743471 RepID=A0A7Y8Y105_9FLAO|nr:polysaccharide biosynthesis C-terminal domain-containing protein [Flavobacterium agri]NUY79311.1 polysaccharide biosynthesis C-terminal domain-containing protein [Flavobacterium agri]NYA69335.1 polysaccharide biosynthesis C-terminal domain-containing protein [Flavobacterium agri]
MGIVIKQSISNTVITYVGFAIGAANTLFMYPHILGKDFYGLTGYVLSAANVIMPLMAFGVHNTLVKFFSGYRSEQEKDRFLTYLLLLPLLVAVPLLILSLVFYEPVAALLSKKNPIIFDYCWQIPLIGLFMAYFEIFYAWVKVHLKSVFGSFAREILLRLLITAGLFTVFFKWISAGTFVNLTVLIYGVITIVMGISAFKVRQFKADLRFPENRKAVFNYSIYIILSGSIANMLLDLDKFMMGFYIHIDNIAFYNVAIFIATVISVPSRAMHQIAYPITAKLMAEDKYIELNELYKKTSISLQLVGGLVFVGILVNIKQVYLLLPAEYGQGMFTVFVIGLSKYLDLILGNNNAIIFNSKYYRAVLLLGLLLAALMIGLNMFLIPKMGIDGAALATLASIALYSLSKLLFVVFKMKLYPFSKQTLYSFAILTATFCMFYYWDFPFHPIPNIALKSILVTVFFIGINYWLRISPDVNSVIDKGFALLRRK